jgi:hypothetical protein
MCVPILSICVTASLCKASSPPSYPAAVLGTPSLATSILLPLNETSGSLAHDLAGAPTDGTYVGSPMLGVMGDDYNAMLAGDALRGGGFRAAPAKYCAIPSNKIQAAMGSDWTLNVWMRYSGVPGTSPNPFTDPPVFGSSTDPAGVANVLAVNMSSRADGYGSPNLMSFSLRPAHSGGPTGNVACDLLTWGVQYDGQWHLVTIVYRTASNGTIQIGLDGAFGDAVSNANPAMPSSIGAFGIGAFLGAGVAVQTCPFDFADVSFHTRAFGAEEAFKLGELYNGRTGELSHPSAVVSRFFTLAQSRRVGLGMIGDSNVVRSFIGAPMGDQGYILTTATWVRQGTGNPLAALLVGANSPSNGSVPLLGVYTVAVVEPDGMAPQHVQDRNLARWNTDGNPNPEPFGFEADVRWKSDGVHQPDSTGSGIMINPGDPNWSLASSASLKVTYDYATFVDDGTYLGAGSIFPNLKIGSSVVGGTSVATKTGANGWASGALSAGVLAGPAVFRYQTADHDAVGPLAVGYTHIENVDQPFGFDLNLFWAYGGRSAYTVCQALANSDKTPLSKLVTYFQCFMAPSIALGQTPTFAVQIMQGQNDRNIENSGPVSSYVYTPGIGTFSASGNAGASSRDGYKNNLLTIINRLKDAWVAAGYSASDFYVILGPGHQISPAPGNWKMELGYGRAEREIADSMDNVLIFDGPKIVGYDTMIQANGYAADGAGATHLSRTGFVLLGAATGELAIRPWVASGACCTGAACEVATQLACMGQWTIDASCSPDPCPQPSGTCCTPDGACTFVLQTACGATWNPGGACTPIRCPQPGIHLNSPSTNVCNNASTLTVTIDAAVNDANVAGGQFFIGWDISRLSLTSVAAGPGLFKFYDQPNGGGRDIAVGIPDGAPTIGAQTMATLTFAVSGVEACGLADLVFFRSTIIPSRLTDNQANDLNAPTTNLAAVTLDRASPMLPALMTLNCNTDPTFCRSRQTLSVIAIDVCAGPISATARVAGIPIAFPYDFPVGTTTLTWSASDACGNTSTAMQDVVVTDNEMPSIECPPEIAVNADVGGCAAVLSAAQVGSPTTGDNCAVQSIVPSVGGSPISFPYLFPQGVTTVTWTVTDVHGNSNSCLQAVTVNAFNTMSATVELDGVSPSPFTRCITFDLYRAGCPPVATVTRDLTFVAGIGTADIDVPCGVFYTAVTATDTLHTLRRSSGPVNFGTSGVSYFADFTSTTGKKLDGGNFNNDAYIDILDFGGYISRFGTDPGASTPCGYSPTFRNADFSGDGSVGIPDFNLISFNFLKFRDLDPCGAELAPGQNRPAGPLASISIRDPRVSEIPGMIRADVNHDGIIDAADIARVASHGLPTCVADFNDDGTATVQDIFDFLNAWFIGHPGADVNGTCGVTVQDIFDFLAAWFAAC